jgi:hypothetical protein
LVDVEGLICGDTVNISRIVLSEEEADQCESFSHTGCIVDDLCWEATDHVIDNAKLDVNPEDHTKMVSLSFATNLKYIEWRVSHFYSYQSTPIYLQCLLMEPCVASGYSLLEQLEDGTYSQKYILDDTSNVMTVELFEASSKENDYEVVSEGSLCVGNVVTLSSITLASDKSKSDFEAEVEESDAKSDGAVSSAFGFRKACVIPAIAVLAVLI